MSPTKTRLTQLAVALGLLALGFAGGYAWMTRTSDTTVVCAKHDATSGRGARRNTQRTQPLLRRTLQLTRARGLSLAQGMCFGDGRVPCRGLHGGQRLTTTNLGKRRLYLHVGDQAFHARTDHAFLGQIPRQCALHAYGSP